MQIVIGRIGQSPRNAPNTQYIGRGSALGNPFVIGRDGGRGEVCDKYGAWFYDQVAARNPEVLTELREIWRKGQTHGTVKLECFCAPQRCHGGIIKSFIESHLE